MDNGVCSQDTHLASLPKKVERRHQVKPSIRIGLIGDHDSSVAAHQAIPIALSLAAEALALQVEPVWVATDTIEHVSQLIAFDGLWCVPASPYRSMDGALRAIRYARVERCPYLGTCGGFQHAALEYARHVLGWSDAEHAETAPEASRPVITPLTCALVETTGRVFLQPDSRMGRAYGTTEIREGYRCRYGLNPEFRSALEERRQLRVVAQDENDEARGIELVDHPFFVATLSSRKGRH